MDKKTYRSARGKVVDIERLSLKNEKVTAVGNQFVNARGDELGPGGVIKRTRNEVLKSYNKDNPNAVKKTSPKPQAEETVVEEAPVKEPAKTTARRKKKDIEPDVLEENNNDEE